MGHTPAAHRHAAHFRDLVTAHFHNYYSNSTDDETEIKYEIKVTITTNEPTQQITVTHLTSYTTAKQINTCV